MEMENVTIGGSACSLFVSGVPEVFLVQPTARHEAKHLQHEAELLARECGRGFAFMAFDVGDWAEALMPWHDDAVSRDDGVGRHSHDTLCHVERCLLPWLALRYGALSCVLGGYSLGGLFALWASCHTSAFAAVAAASPSVWIRGWTEFAETHTVQAAKVYLSLGDREEHCKNVRMARVGDCIRRQKALLTAALGSENTVLEWNPGNHFHDEPQRMARAFAWCAGRV